MSDSPAVPRPSSRFQGFLNLVERVGNTLPNPTTLFALLAGLIVGLSWVFSKMGVAVIHPVTGQTVVAVNLLNLEGLHRMLVSFVPNFVGFPPLGTVLACLIGIAVAERTGLIAAGLRPSGRFSRPSLCRCSCCSATRRSWCRAPTGWATAAPTSSPH